MSYVAPHKRKTVVTKTQTPIRKGRDTISPAIQNVYASPIPTPVNEDPRTTPVETQWKTSGAILSQYQRSIKESRLKKWITDNEVTI